MDLAIFYGAIVLFVLFGPWVLVWRGRLKRKQERTEDQERWRYLSDRVLGLEAAVHELNSAAPGACAHDGSSTAFISC